MTRHYRITHYRQGQILGRVYRTLSRHIYLHEPEKIAVEIGWTLLEDDTLTTTESIRPWPEDRSGILVDA